MARPSMFCEAKGSSVFKPPIAVTLFSFAEMQLEVRGWQRVLNGVELDNAKVDMGRSE